MQTLENAQRGSSQTCCQLESELQGPPQPSKVQGVWETVCGIQGCG